MTYANGDVVTHGQGADWFRRSGRLWLAPGEIITLAELSCDTEHCLNLGAIHFETDRHKDEGIWLGKSRCALRGVPVGSGKLVGIAGVKGENKQGWDANLRNLGLMFLDGEATVEATKGDGASYEDSRVSESGYFNTTVVSSTIGPGQ